MPTPALRTTLCDLLHIDLPIIRAPIGSVASAGLVAAVPNAGGLGMLSAVWRTAESTRQAMRGIRALTPHPFGVNLGFTFPIREQLDVCLEVGVPIISFLWGDAAPYVAEVHGAGALVTQTVASAEEALALYAGQSVGLATRIQSAGEIVAELADGAAQALRRGAALLDLASD